jgi:hypothetical protein
LRLGSVRRYRRDCGGRSVEGPRPRRRTVVEVLAGLSGAHRRAVEDVYTRATVQPAITALHAVGLTDEKFLRCLRVRELTTDGAELQLHDRTIPVPASLRRALVRQRLHAGVIGQRPGDQLRTFDGSVSSPRRWPGTDRAPFPSRLRHQTGGVPRRPVAAPLGRQWDRVISGGPP